MKTVSSPLAGRPFSLTLISLATTSQAVETTGTPGSPSATATISGAGPLEERDWSATDGQTD